MTPEIDVSVVDTSEGFARLRDDWQACVSAARQPSIFQTWEWLHPWWQHYGAARTPHLVVARSAGRVLGLLPLYLEDTALWRGAITSRCARFVGTGGDTAPDYLGPVADGEREGEVLQALASFLARDPAWRILQLREMPAASPFPGLLRQALRRERLAFHVSDGPRCPYIPLPASWDAYLAELSADRRKNIRYARRRIERDLSARFVVWDNGARLGEAMEQLIRLHGLRWDSRGQSHGFASREYVGFHADVMRACHERGWLRLYALEAGGAPIAMLYCYRFRGETSYFQGGFDPAHERLSPGSVLIGYAIEHAISEGTAVFDMLAGEHAYKAAWARERRETLSLRAYRRGLTPALHRARREGLPHLKRRLTGALGRARRN